VEADATLVRADGAVELDAETTVHLHPTFIVGPGHAEHNLALRFDDALKDAVILVLLVTLDHGAQRFEHFTCGLEELRLAGIAARHDFENFCNVFVHMFLSRAYLSLAIAQAQFQSRRRPSYPAGLGGRTSSRWRRDLCPTLVPRQGKTRRKIICGE
jgi:hypothetical protein